jgi:RNA polymerase sigma-54 factor
MQLNTSLSARMEQRQMIAPRMIQSMEILQLGVMALQERLEHEMEENPVLEPGEAPPVEDADADADEAVAVPEPEADVTDPRKELVIEDSTDNEKDFDRLEAMNEAWADHFNEDSRPSSNHIDEAMDKKHDAMLNMASRPQSLQDYLNDQVGFLDADEAEKELIRYVISHTDERGYLSTPLEEIALSLGEAVPLARLEAALAKVQKLEPAGVGARTVEECLLLQVTNETPYREVVRLLIQNHLEDLQHNRMPIIEKKTGYSFDIIQHAFEVLKHLNPKPGAAFTSDNIPYVVPDILVERKDDGEYDVKLEDDWTPNIFISRRYLDMYRNKAEDPKAREWLKRKLQSAQWLIDAIEQRRSTLIKVTRAIIQHQRAFLDKGPENIEPLKMQQIADLVGVHVTTVSRAVDDKWVQTPRGIFPLKRFFGGGTHTSTGEEVAWETIKQKLLEIIGNEDKANPLSDEDLVNKLSETGYPVARRTVTKYRKMLSIPSSRQRKVWTE